MGHILPSDHPASTDRRGPGKAGKKRSFVEEVAQDQQVRVRRFHADSHVPLLMPDRTGLRQT